MCLCHAGRVFDPEMVMLILCTIARAHADHYVFVLMYELLTHAAYVRM